MSLDQLLVWFIGLSMGVMAARLVASGQRRSGWLVVSLLVLAVLAAGLALAPAWAGRLAALLWVPLFVLPALLFRAIQAAAARQRYPLAQRLARLAALLHPADGWREQPRILAAHALYQRGDAPAAHALLADLARAPGGPGEQALVNLLRLERRWAELRALLERHGAPPADPRALGAYARALAELGDLPALLRLLDAATDRLERDDPEVLHLTRLFLAALTGRPDLALTLLAGPLSRFGPPVRQYWLARAWQAAGEDARAGTLLLGLLASPDAMVAASARDALAQPAPRLSPAATPPPLLAAIDRAWAAITADHASPTLARPPAGRPLATVALCALLFAVFLAELPGGATDPDNLRAMGAMLAPLPHLDGQWWRLVTANFLHFGGLHLALNVLGLWYFGRYLERVVGPTRFLTVFFASGIGAMASFLALSSLTHFGHQMVVGASACLMGIVGFTAVALFAQWRRGRSRAVRRELGSLGALLALQTVFDLTTPQVSFIGHSSGLVLGLLLGLALYPWRAAAPAPAVARR